MLLEVRVVNEKKAKKIKSTFNGYSILHPVQIDHFVRCCFDSYFRLCYSIINQIANYKWFLSCLYIWNWNAIAKPLHLRKKRTNKEKTHQIRVSQIREKNGHHETALYRSFLINRRMNVGRNVMSFFDTFECATMLCTTKIRKIPNTNTISTYKRFIAQIGHIFI